MSGRDPQKAASLGCALETIDDDITRAVSLAQQLVNEQGNDPSNRRLEVAFQVLVLEPTIRTVARRVAAFIHANSQMMTVAIIHAAGTLVADEELPPLRDIAKRGGAIHPALGSKRAVRELVDALFADGDFHAEACGIVVWLAMELLSRSSDPVVAEALSKERIEAWAREVASQHEER